MLPDARRAYHEAYVHTAFNVSDMKPGQVGWEKYLSTEPPFTTLNVGCPALQLTTEASTTYFESKTALNAAVDGLMNADSVGCELPLVTTKKDLATHIFLHRFASW